MNGKNVFDVRMQNMARRNRTKRLLKRAIALLSAIVLLFTMNTLKHRADTLERIPMCGLEEHVHTSACYSEDGELVCPIPEHQHTDACYQQRPVHEDTLDGAAVDDEVDDQDELSLALTPEEPTEVETEEAPVEAVEVPEADKYSYSMKDQDSVRLSQVLQAAKVPVKMSQITMVGLVEGETAESPRDLLAIQPEASDFTFVPLKDFDRVEVAVVTDSDIVTFALTDGVAPVIEETPVEEAPAETEEAPAPAEEAEEQTEVGNDAAKTDEVPEEKTEEPEAEEAPAAEDEAEEQPSEEKEKPEVEATEEKTETEEEPSETIEEEKTEEEPSEKTEEEKTEEEPSEKTEEEQTEEENTEIEPSEETEETEQPAEAEETEQPAEDEASEPAEETAEETAAEYAATLDLSEIEEYPLSLRALLAGVEAKLPEAEAEEPAEPAELPAAEWKIEYDESLLSIEAAEDDYRITPVASFEETRILVDNGARYALTLTNYAQAEAEAEPAEEPAWPAQEFEGHAAGMKVSVTAGEGAFPEGTTMVVRPVVDEATLDGIAGTVQDDFVDVKRVHAVDITFYNAEGEEIEPLLPISVVMTVEELEQNQEAVVVHVDNEGGAEVVDASDATDMVETAPAEQAVAFESDAFSVYALVVTETIETRYIAADGATWNISVGFGPESGIPANAELDVRELTGEASELCLNEAAEALRGVESITLARFFDITILVDGQPVQPAAPVEVRVTLADGTDDAVKAVHFDHTGEMELVDADREEEAVTFNAESFSVYGVVYTVDFHFGVDGETFEFTLPGGGAVGMRELAEALHLAEGEDADPLLFVESIESVTFSDETLIKVVSVPMNMTVGALKQRYDLESEYSGELTEAQIAELNDKVLLAPDLALVSLKPFDTPETLTVALRTGETFTISVTDAQLTQEVITASGETYLITVTYDDAAKIPEGAELKVTEILPGDEAYASYYSGAAQTAGIEQPAASDEAEESEEPTEVAAGEGAYARFFDIEIWADDQKIEPKAPVTVEMALTDAPEEELQVVHFDEEDGPEVLGTEASETANVRFETDSFSVYAVIADQQGINVNNLNGITCTIRHDGHYLTGNVDNTSAPNRLNSTNVQSEAAIWHFEATGTQDEYRIYTLKNGEKWYLEFTFYGDNGTQAYNSSGDTAHVKLQNETSPWISNCKIHYENGVYQISVNIGGNNYYLNDWQSGRANAFAAYKNPSNDNNLAFDFKNTADVVSGRQYVVLVKYNNEYYVVENDGRLTKALDYNPDTNIITADNPMLWTVEGNASNRHIYFQTEAVGFDASLQASDYYRRYLDSNVLSAITEEKDGVNVSIEQVNQWYDLVEKDEQGNPVLKRSYRVTQASRNALWGQTVLNTTNDRVFAHNETDNYHLGVVLDNGVPVRVIGGQDAAHGVEVYFAQTTDVPTVNEDGADYRRHTVNHIDIAISGESVVNVPLAYGTYYYKGADGQMHEYEVISDTTLELKNDKVRIEPEDMKHATISAYRKDDGTPLDNAFVVSGYSSNAHTEYSDIQVRIAGRFKVADLDTPGGNDDTTMGLRLANEIEYVISAPKNLDFPLVDTEHGYGQLYEKLADGSYRELYINLDVEMGAKFSYFDPRNECPPLQKSFMNQSWDNGYHQFVQENEYDHNLWKRGGIPAHNGSGMDFVLGGNAEASANIVALEITKMIVDENGKLIKPAHQVVNTVKIFEHKTDAQGYYSSDADGIKIVNATTANSVADINVEGYTAEPGASIYTGYDELREKAISVGSNGMGLVYDYAVKPGMYYISENHGMHYISENHGEDDIARTITDMDGVVWEYKETYITTEYVRRGNQYDNKSTYPNPMHYSGKYSDSGDSYRSVPEVLGYFGDLNGNTRKSGFLEFFVYNVYTCGTKLEVEKVWKTEAPKGAEAVVELYYRTRLNGSTNDDDWSEFAPVRGDDGKLADGFDPKKVKTTTISLRASNVDKNNWKGAFTGLPRTITLKDENNQDVVYEVDYTAEETAVKVNGVDVTDQYKATVVKQEPDEYNANPDYTDGKVKISNEKNNIRVVKRWFRPDGESAANPDTNVVVTAEMWRRGTKAVSTPSYKVTIMVKTEEQSDDKYQLLWSEYVKQNSTLRFSVGCNGTSELKDHHTILPSGVTIIRDGNEDLIYSNTGKLKSKSNIYKLENITQDVTIYVWFSQEKVGTDGFGYNIVSIDSAYGENYLVDQDSDEWFANITLDSSNNWTWEPSAEQLAQMNAPDGLRYNYYIKPETIQETGTGGRFNLTGPTVSTEQVDGAVVKVISLANTYKKDYVNLDVEKVWVPEGETPADAQVTLELYYALVPAPVNENTTWPDMTFWDDTAQTGNYKPVYGDPLFAEDEIETEMTLTAAENWKGAFEHLPKTVKITENEVTTEYEVDYAVRETSVVVNGNTVTGKYTVTYAKNRETGESASAASNGTLTVTNTREKVKVDVEKAWSPLPQSDENPSVTVQLVRYAKKTKGTVTLTLKSDKGDPIEGATFDLYKRENSNDTRVSGPYTTGRDGKLRVTGIDPGVYYLHQVSTPYTYDLPVERNTVPFEFTETTEPQEKNVSMTNVATGQKGYYTLVLTDVVTGLPIAGAQFKLVDANGSQVGALYTTDGDGTISAEINDPGTYRFVLTQVAPGYKAATWQDEDGFVVQEDHGDQRRSVSTTNKLAAKGSVTLTLTDRTTGEALSGGEFKLYKNGTHYTDKGSSFTTDGSGEIAVNGLDEGSYYFQEVTAPSGYILNASTDGLTFEVPDNGQVDNAYSVATTNQEQLGNVTVKLWAKQINFDWQCKETYTFLKPNRNYTFVVKLSSGVAPNNVWFYMDEEESHKGGDPTNGMRSLADAGWTTTDNVTFTKTFQFEANRTYNLVMVTSWGLQNVESFVKQEDTGNRSAMMAASAPVAGSYGAAPKSSPRLFASSGSGLRTGGSGDAPSIVQTSATLTYISDSDSTYMLDSTFQPVVVTLDGTETPEPWKHEFAAEDKYDADGNLYYYYVVETARTPSYYWIESYAETETADGGKHVVITNKNLAELEITKTVSFPTDENMTATFSFHVAGPGLGTNGKDITMNWPFEDGATTKTVKLTQEDGIRPGANYTVTEAVTGANITGYTRTTTVTSGSSTTTFAQANEGAPSGTAEVDGTTHQGSISFTNTYTRDTVDVPVKKIWVFAEESGVESSEVTDGTNGKWPNGMSVTVELFKQVGENGTPVTTGRTEVLTGGKTSATFTGLPEYEGGQLVTYTVQEIGVDTARFGVEIGDPDPENNNTITITNREKVTSLTITKSFGEGSPLSDAEKAQVTFTVRGQGLPEEGLTETYDNFVDGVWTLNQSNGIIAGQSYTVTETNAKYAQYTRTTTYRVNGAEEAETAAEAVIEADSVSQIVPVGADTGAGTIVFVNSYQKKPTEISGTKVWVDKKTHTTETNEVSVRLTLYRKTDSTDWTKVTEGDYTLTWTDNVYTFTGLDMYSDATEDANGKLYTYKVVETPIDNYSTSYTGGKDHALNGEQIINTELTSIYATKVWMNEQGNITASMTNNASATFRLQSKLATAESWADVTDVTVTANGNGPTASLPNTAGEDVWKAAWNNLPKYRIVHDETTDTDTVVEIQYRVVETAATITVDGNVIDLLPTDGALVLTDPNTDAIIVNTLPTTEIEVTKEWKDCAGAARVPPVTEISFTLHQKVGEGNGTPYTAYGNQGKGTVSYTAGTGWDTVTISDLPRFACQDGAWKAVSYYVVEDDRTGVTITYRKGSGTAVSAVNAAILDSDTDAAPASSDPAPTGDDPAPTGDDPVPTGDDANTAQTESNRKITIVNTDNPIQLKIVKVDSDSMGEGKELDPLPGAGFTIIKVNESNAATEATQPSITCTTTGANNLTGADGVMNFAGLPAGYYKVTETKTPTGYIRTGSGEFYVRVDSNATNPVKLVTWTPGEGNTPGTWNDAGNTDKLVFTAAQDSEPATVTVGNDKGASLPSTGGIGTGAYTFGGIALMLLAVALLILRKREA